MKTIQDASAETIDLIRVLRDAKIGELIGYDQLDRIVLGDVRHERYHCLCTARKILLRESGMVFAVVRGKGIQRANDEQILGDAGARVSKIHKTAKVGMKVLSCADFDKLNQDQKLKHYATASVLGALAYATQNKQVRQIENRVAKSTKQLAIGETLSAFSNGSLDTP